MPLNDYLHGIVERYIDEGIQATPVLIQNYRQYATKEMGIKTMEDYIFGFIQGVITGEFIVTYRSLYFGLPPQDIQMEVGLIIFKRSKEIREAIFKAG